MFAQSFSSVVRLLITGLLFLMLSACTAQYTREVGRTALRDVGMGTSVKITRTGSWSLPEGTKVRVAPMSIAGTDPNAYPRLGGYLDRLLENIAAEWFHHDGQREVVTSTDSGVESGVLLRLSLAAAADRLSSVQEIADNSGLRDESAGHDRLHLVMKVYDARTGRLLDTMAGEAVSGWRWHEQRVADLAEPTLRAMLSRLRGATTSIE